MQFSKAVLIAVLAAFAQAQSIGDLVGQLPACATTCLTPAIQAAGCGLTDYVCQCSEPGHNKILASSAACFSSGCSNDEILKTQGITNQICAIALAGGASSSAASVESSASSVVSSASSAISSMSESSASAESSASSAISSASSSASAASSAESSASSSAASSGASSASSASSAAAGSTGSSAPSATSSAPATQTSNSANSFRVGAGMIGAAVVAAIAL